MFLRAIFDILLARWLVVATCLFSSLLGGGYIVLTATPRYQATAQVALDYLKPNPVTGTVVTSKTVTTYVNSQLEMVRDPQVVLPAAEALGLLDNPQLQANFAAQPNAPLDDPDAFPRWVARQLIAGIGVKAIPDSNRLEISAASTSAAMALETVEAVRTAYVQASVTARRTGALESADNLSAQADRTRAELRKFEDAKRLWQDQNGVLTAQESRFLVEMVTSVTSAYVEQASDTMSGARLASAQVALDQATKSLGPNHPRLRELRASRDLLAAQFERERAESSQTGASAGARERAKQAAIETQKEKVLSQRSTVLSLRLIEDQIESREDALILLDKKIAELRQQSAVREADVASVGEATVKPRAVFPNPYLILGGTGVLGLAVGSLLALFLELLQRHARNARDLESSVGAPLWGVVPALITSGDRGRWPFGRWFGSRQTDRSPRPRRRGLGKAAI